MTVPLTRRAVATLFAAGAVGCLGRSNGESDDDDNPALGAASQMRYLELTSPAFDDGDPIPREYGSETENVNPPLSIDGVPNTAESLALVMDDPDAVEAAGKVWIHWLVWNIPPGTTDIPEGWEPESAVEGTNDFGGIGYDGPSPPDREHTYRFKCYALDARLDLDAGATVDELGIEMDGHTIARTQLTGTYAP